MTEHDWSAPKTPPKLSPSGKSPWKIDVDPKRPLDDARIYEVPGINGLPIRLIATCPNKKDAALIVDLYEKWRNA